MDPELAWCRLLTAKFAEGSSLSIGVDWAPDYAHQAYLLDDLPFNLSYACEQAWVSTLSQNNQVTIELRLLGTSLSTSGALIRLPLLC
jgi:hypothetical protein